jgi:multidrug efflux system membrane fusion protein
LLLDVRKNSTVVPTAAILRGPQGTFVYAVKPDSTVEARTVTVALTQGDTTAIASGLNVGDTVVTDGQDKLDSGSKIVPRQAAPIPSAGHSTAGAPGTPGS